ncbi:MAG: flagellum-specific ATP synthase FliI, partial [Proteobacteria bacterium]|nr:flagellum-specific ATP synthase FliI [Pseudomonadota bacterium]
MLSLAEPLLGAMATSAPALGPLRYGLVVACDGGLIEVSGLSVPVGALCRIGQYQTAEVIGFRNGRTLMMMLGDAALLRPGARVCPEGHPGMLAVGEALLGRAVDGEGHPIDHLGPLHPRAEWPAGGIRAGA